MIIKNITKDKKGKYQINFDDNKISTYDDVILENKLLYKREINDEDLKQILSQTEYYDSYQKIINFCMIKVRSQKEIEEYIKKINFESQKEKVLNDLKKIGLINDLYFAKSYANDKFRIYNYGPEYIKETLKNHDIKEEDIDVALKELSVDEVYNKLSLMIEKKIKFAKNDSKMKLKQKLLYELTNRGFNHEDISNTFEELYQENDDAIEKAYQKIIKKTDDEHVIMKKLTAKGFAYEEVISFMNKKDKNY